MFLEGVELIQSSQLAGRGRASLPQKPRQHLTGGPICRYLQNCPLHCDYQITDLPSAPFCLGKLSFYFGPAVFRFSRFLIKLWAKYSPLHRLLFCNRCHHAGRMMKHQRVTFYKPFGTVFCSHAHCWQSFGNVSTASVDLSTGGLSVMSGSFHSLTLDKPHTEWHSVLD